MPLLYIRDVDIADKSLKRLHPCVLRASKNRGRHAAIDKVIIHRILHLLPYLLIGERVKTYLADAATELGRYIRGEKMGIAAGNEDIHMAWPVDIIEDGYEIQQDDDLDYTSSSYGGSSGLGSLYAKPAFPKPSAAPAQPAAQNEPAPAQQAGEPVVGGLVKHGVFGQGKIVAIAGSGDSAKITVLFGNGVRRTFMLKFAPLELL